MRISVDFTLCESNALCVDSAPELFDIDDNDYLVILEEGTVRPEQHAAARAAALRCPKRAITLLD